MFAFLENYVDRNVPSFFTWQKKQLTAVGLLIPEKTKHFILFLLYDVTLLLIIIAILFMMELTQIIIKYDDFKIVMINLAQFSLHIAIEMQILLWIFVKNKLLKVSDLIERPSFQFKTFSIKDIAFIPTQVDDGATNYKDLQFSKKSKIEANPVYSFQNELKEEMFNARFKSWLITMILRIAIIVDMITWYSITLFITSPYEEFNPYINATSTYRILPFNTYFPFDISVSDGYFWSAFFLQFVVETAPAFLYMAIYNFTLGIIIHITSQLRVIKRALNNVDEKKSIYLKEIKIINCCNELQTIFKTQQMFEDVHNVTAFVKYLLVLVNFCCTITSVPLSDTTIIFLGLVSIMFIMSFEPLLLCWYSQTMSEEFSSVINAIYELDWINYPVRLRKHLIFTMQILNKPVDLTILGTIKLDLAFFIGIMKMSYSMYTMIITTGK